MDPPEKKSITSEIFSGVGPTFWISLVALLIFSYGAAKVNWSVNQSYFWSIVAFLFSGFYYPYYAFFQIPSTMIQAVGGRRR